MRPGLNSRIFATSGHPAWLREAMVADIASELASRDPSGLSAVEISGAPETSWQGLGWGSFTALDYPEFDLCHPRTSLPGPFDVVLCDQVLEHVVDPLAAVDTLRRLCKPTGCVLVSTPFLIRLHDHPGDYWRFTPDGLRLLLQARGLEPLWVRSWGNRRAIVSNFDRWTSRLPWQTMRNEDDLPVVVWSIACPADRGEQDG
jgi:SAM-dependent methyltransferase